MVYKEFYNWRVRTGTLYNVVIFSYLLLILIVSNPGWTMILISTCGFTDATLAILLLEGIFMV